MILDGAETYDDYKGLSKERSIVDNCKNMYFAGYETTATTLSWTLMLLAASPDWQARVHAEVLETCKDGFLPDANALRNMKTLTMVVLETLRLYPPATFVITQAVEDIDFKGIMIPKDMNIQIQSQLYNNLFSYGVLMCTGSIQKDLLMGLLRLARFHRLTCRLASELEYAPDNTSQWQN